MTHVFSSAQLPDGLPENETAIHAWNEFYARFPTEEHCLQELFGRLDASGLLQCRYCGFSKLERRHGSRVCICCRCSKKTWFTAGTFFNRIRSTRNWLLVIYMAEQGVVISSSRLHRLIGVSQSTALNILKKIATVIQSHMDEDAPLLSSSLFALAVCKRSRETPARAHPLSELEEVEKSLHNGNLSGGRQCEDQIAGAPPCKSGASEVDTAGCADRLTEASSQKIADLESGDGEGSTRLSGIERQLYELLSETPLQFDILSERSGIAAGEMSAALVMLELGGLVTRLPGDRYIREITKLAGKSSDQSCLAVEPPAQAASAVAAFIEYVRTHLHGISRKYLQKYLASFWCHIDRSRWRSGALLQACLSSCPITYDQIINYVSPALVVIQLCL